MDKQEKNKELDKRNLIKPFLTLCLGVLIGFAISSLNTVSVKELKTFSDTFAGKDSDVSFANMLGLASFNGAWIVVSGGEMVNDVNSIDIDCWLKEKTCNVAQADVVFDDSFSNNISYYEIIEWSEDGQITAISSSACEDQILKADIKTKVVTLTESSKENLNETICVQNNEPMVLKLGSRGY